jgi:hypothetical protein
MCRAAPPAFAYLMLLILTAGAVAAQSSTRARRPQSAAPPEQATKQTPTSADEDFDLNISERRITQHDFFDSTSVAVGDANAPLVRIGVALSAQEIDVLLRNVHGHVRFRASLDPVLRVLDARRKAAPPAPPPVP